MPWAEASATSRLNSLTYSSAASLLQKSHNTFKTLYLGRFVSAVVPFIKGMPWECTGCYDARHPEAQHRGFPSILPFLLPFQLLLDHPQLIFYLRPQVHMIADSHWHPLQCLSASWTFWTSWLHSCINSSTSCCAVLRSCNTESVSLIIRAAGTVTGAGAGRIRPSSRHWHQHRISPELCRNLCFLRLVYFLFLGLLF